MKRKLIFLNIIVISFLFFKLDVYATVKTYDRTEQNLLIPDSVIVTENNKKAILDTPAVDSSDKIYDFAEVLTTKEEEKLLKNMKNFIDESNMDLIFLTAQDTNSYSIEDYVYQFYDYNSFNKNGLIFFVLVGSENHIFMGTSGNINQYYSSERINQILEYVIKYIDKKEYYEGFDVYTKIVKGFYNIDNGAKVNIKNNGEVVKTVSWLNILIFSLAATFIIVFFSVHFIIKNKNIKYIRKYIDGNTFFINKELEVCIGTNIEKEEKK